MAHFFDLPVEIRLDIYSLTFGSGKIVLETSRSDTDSLLPVAAKAQYRCPRSAQLLATCRTILEEARPILYANITFHVISHVFAGKWPSNFTDGSTIAPFIKHLVWQVDCDMMKLLYEDDLSMKSTDFDGLSSLEIRARAETWRDSFLGEECDRDRFVKGREQSIVYIQHLRRQMTRKVDLVEDRRLLGKGCVVLRLQPEGRRLTTTVSAAAESERRPC
jgi:hypothetical protein